MCFFLAALSVLLPQHSLLIYSYLGENVRRAHPHQYCAHSDLSLRLPTRQAVGVAQKYTLKYCGAADHPSFFLGVPWGPACGAAIVGVAAANTRSRLATAPQQPQPLQVPPDSPLDAYRWHCCSCFALQQHAQIPQLSNGPDALACLLPADLCTLSLWLKNSTVTDSLWMSPTRAPEMLQPAGHYSLHRCWILGTLRWTLLRW